MPAAQDQPSAAKQSAPSCGAATATRSRHQTSLNLPCPSSITLDPSSTDDVRRSTAPRRLSSTRKPAVESALRRVVSGAVVCPALPPFKMAKSTTTVPRTPRVISPSPTPSSDHEYFGPTTRSAAVRKRLSASQTVNEVEEREENSRSSRTRSRSPIVMEAREKRLETNNGHLAPPPPPPPPLQAPATLGGWSWRDFSRSPSPLGLIPIHRHWRTFVHKHEVPRKALHVSIGFFVAWLYAVGTRVDAVPPYLMAALVPIATTDWLRHRYQSVNRLYVNLLGALMRESEYSGWNGVIFYLLGAWIVLRFFPKDVGVMSVLLLSWCDTAASTFGRLWGRYTPRIRRGKSLAGSAAAFLVGLGTSCFFYAWLVPTFGPMAGDEGFMFKGVLSLPQAALRGLGMSDRQPVQATGGLALGIVSLWSGLVASASEVVDFFGWDDNLTIPVLSGIGMLGFLKIFG
ncbi:hypothetical protein L249_6159 [Ophiocordyceps polyrhachis-furcata BCC 54312]|uniref:Phosphatidate cytidylyltransferase n=1 Tax=Ophiocordyceps polyrhachis-furcata BCC 54312 TaxID=1330021 RepID=A0A367LIN1_9HYPO|nr:hypothetical protein L249_6159 [Ophiocordyceps polyrhachis-furcata BCC 54312]